MISFKVLQRFDANALLKYTYMSAFLDDKPIDENSF